MKSKNSYSRVVEASAVVGGAQAINLLLGLVRSKVIAIFIGPTGLGILGSFLAIRATAVTFSGLGIQQSGVREVAASLAVEDRTRVGDAVLAIRRMCVLSGAFGAAALVLFSAQISQAVFHSDEYALSVALLGASVFLMSIAGGLKALIQGNRRIGDLARLNILSGVAGTLIAVVFYGTMGIQGIVPAIISLAFANFAASWWFSRRITVEPSQHNWIQSFITASGLLTLGVAIMCNGLLLGLVELATRSLIVFQLDIAAAGLYSAAFRISSLSTNMVTGAMAADFFPALTSESENPGPMKRLVNEQTEVGILLVLPGLLMTLALSPWVVQILYSSEFSGANALLQWFIPGCFLRVLSWPAGFIAVAKGKSLLLIVSQTLLCALHVGLIMTGLNLFGLEGVALAFFGYNLVYLLVYLAIGKQLIGFSWSMPVIKLAGYSAIAIIVLFLVTRLLPTNIGGLIAALLAVMVSISCLRQLTSKLGSGHRITRALLRIPILKQIVSVRQ